MTYPHAPKVIGNNNTDSSRIVIEHMTFHNSSGAAVRMTGPSMATASTPMTR